MSREPDAAASENQDEKTQAGLHARAAADVNPRAAVVGRRALAGRGAEARLFARAQGIENVLPARVGAVPRCSEPQPSDQ